MESLPTHASSYLFAYHRSTVDVGNVKSYGTWCSYEWMRSCQQATSHTLACNLFTVIVFFCLSRRRRRYPLVLCIRLSCHRTNRLSVCPPQIDRHCTINGDDKTWPGGAFSLTSSTAAVRDFNVVSMGGHQWGWRQKPSGCPNDITFCTKRKRLLPKLITCESVVINTKMNHCWGRSTWLWRMMSMIDTPSYLCSWYRMTVFILLWARRYFGTKVETKSFFFSSILILFHLK